MDGFVPWPGSFREQYLKARYWREKPLASIIETAAARWPRRIAITFNGQGITYAELQRRVNRLALHLGKLGHRPLDRLLLQLPNCPETLYLYFAAVKIGVIPVMALPAHRLAEMAFFAEFAAVKSYCIPGLFGKFDYPALAREVRMKAPSLKHIIVHADQVPDGMISLQKLLDDPLEERINGETIFAVLKPDPFEPAVFQLSGGTTGIPKLIPRTHNDYYYNVYRNSEICGFSGDTVYLVAIPMTHNFATACPGWQGVFLHGGRVVLSPSPSPDTIFPLIEREKVTTIPAVPAIVINMLNHPDRARYDLSSLQMLHVGGSKLNEETARRIRSELGAGVQQVLGMAEGPLFWTRPDDPEEISWVTQGRPLSPGDEFRIVDAGDRDVKPGEIGELICRGPYTIRGYYKAPAHNREAFSEDGFYRSGDLCRLHESGNIVVEGRSKDTINRGGEKISAEEMENHILAHPRVRLCAYVAMPDPVLGERAVLFAVTREGQTFNMEELSTFLLTERRIARYKLPERLEILDEMPLTPVGKVDKARLREWIAKKLETENRK
ncbi:MAG: AMP-binding protein [Syntrophales bacterium]|jgi:2,3-dihydroxybenzoate-AMP ligase|nr:AMP-binding protein [Syntrophales bacterium]